MQEVASLQNGKNLINEKQAAAILGVSPSTLRNWRQMGKLKFMKVGYVVRYRYEWIEEFIQSNTQEEAL